MSLLTNVASIKMSTDQTVSIDQQILATSQQILETEQQVLIINQHILAELKLQTQLLTDVKQVLLEENIVGIEVTPGTPTTH